MVARRVGGGSVKKLVIGRRWFRDLEEETRFRVCDLLQIVYFCLYLCKCDVHIFVYEEHGGSMVVARFKNCSYDEGEDCSGYGSFVLSFKSGGG